MSVRIVVPDDFPLAITSTPGVNANSVAEHTMALILAVTRRIPAMDAAVRAGQWPRGLLTQLVRMWCSRRMTAG